MGANVTRVFFIGDTVSQGDRRAFDPARDMPMLQAQAERIGDVRLLVVDPIVSAVAADSHKNGEVRRALQPLVDLGAKLDAAVLGITHFSKGTAGRDPTERVTGSLAFGALARVVLAAAKIKSEDGGDRRIFTRAKSNIGPDTGAFEYSLEQTRVPGHDMFASAVLWGGSVEGSARDLLAQAEQSGGQDEPGAVADAEGFLRELLGISQIPSKQVQAEARDAGYSWASIRRAAKNIGVESFRESTGRGGKGQWVWMLKSCKVLNFPQGAQQNNVSILQDFEHLAEIPADDDAEVF